MSSVSTSQGRFSDTNSILWWCGWRFIRSILAWAVIVALVVGGLTGSIASWIPIGVVVGAVVWLIGVRHIDNHASDIIQSFREDAPRVGKGNLNFSDEGGVIFNFESSEGSAFLIEVDKRYRNTTVIVGNSSVAIHGGVYLDLVGRGTYVNDNASEFYYDQITSVNYENGNLVINSSDGQSFSRPAQRKPEGLINELQNRVRNYKDS